MTRPHAVRRSLAGLAVTPLLLAGLTACGDSSGDAADDPADGAAAGAAVLTGVETGDEVDPGDFIDVVVDGLEASTTAHLTMTTSMGQTGDVTAEGDIDYTADPPAMAMTMSMPMMGETPADVRFVDGVLYLSLGDLTGGRFWRLDPSDAESPLGELGPMLDGMDPAAMMRRLEPAIATVTYDGEEDVDGRALDHYELTVDPAELGKAMDAPSGAMAQLPDSVSYDLWLDEEHRMAQVEMELPVQGSTASVEMSIDGWGEDVAIEAPPAGQVTEMPDLGAMTAPTPSA